MLSTNAPPPVLSASSMIGNKVCNVHGEDLGKVDEIMLDTEHNRIAYAVVSFGTFLGLGGKLFAVPWEALAIDCEDKCFILDVTKERLENAPGFDKDNWPVFADRTWGHEVYSYYTLEPYW